jgi:branched-chain amino acid aminotransferase
MIQTSFPIQVTLTEHSRLEETDFSDIPFGKKFSDHMLVADYRNGAWEDIRIMPYAPVPTSLAISGLHYGQSIFEGLKAYRNQADKAVLFRPLDNFHRLNRSAQRLCMPEIPETLFMEGLKELIRVEKNWIPTLPGSALYIRPIYFATDEFLGVRASDSYRFAILLCPVGPYYTEPVNIMVMKKYVRAFEGGTGSAKAAGNYAASMLATREANQAGFHNVLWMDGKSRTLVEESGAMNVFFLIGDTVVTPRLRGSILEGVTRDSVLKLCREKGIETVENDVSIDDLEKAFQEGKLMDAFGTGTAATIAPIAKLQHEDRTLTLPPVSERKISNWLLQELNDIRIGKSEDRFGWVVPVD